MFDVVVVYPLHADESGTKVLLGEKHTGLGQGRIVGPGGKVEVGESLRQAAVRELAEEVGLMVNPDALIPIARLSYPFPSRPHLSQRSHAFIVREFSGQPRASSELSPQWWPLSDIPFERMWPDAKMWLPSALAGGFIRATISIGDDDGVLDVEWES